MKLYAVVQSAAEGPIGVSVCECPVPALHCTAFTLTTLVSACTSVSGLSAHFILLNFKVQTQAAAQQEDRTVHFGVRLSWQREEREELSIFKFETTRGKGKKEPAVERNEGRGKVSSRREERIQYSSMCM